MEYYPPGGVSATDSTKLPVDGSGAMTNRLKWSGTQTSSGNSDTNAWRSSDGTWNLNTPAGVGVNLTCNGVFYGGWNTDGIYNSGGRGYILYADAGSANTALYQIIRAGTKLVLHVPTGATHESQVNGVRVGGFPLTPSDLPAIRFDAPLVDGQSLSFGDYNYLETGTPTTNNLFTVSGTGNITFTSLYAGVLEIYVSIAANGAQGMLRVEKNGSFVREGFLNAFVNRVTIATAVPIAIGDVIKIPIYSSGSATLSVWTGTGTLFMALRS